MAMRSTLWLLGPLLLVLAPHALKLPLWISFSWLACAGLCLQGARNGIQPVGRMLKTLFVLAGVVGVLWQYGTVIGPDAGVALLTFLCGAKLLETKTTRDRLGLLFIGCFLLVAQFLEGQNLFTAAYMSAAAIALVAGMIATQGGAAWRPTLTLAAHLMAQALPLALLIFLLFPRMEGPLWRLPQQTSARSGLSDRMSPGDISGLILSDELAFRAEFVGTVPPLQALYWRGPVLWDYDGRTWHTDPPLQVGLPQAKGFGLPLHYRLMLEADRQRWLPLLGLPLHLPELPGNPTRLGPDLQWQAREPIDQRLRYEVDAYPDYRLDPTLPAALRERALALPADGNPRSRDLAQSWRDLADFAIVAQALTLFRTQAFFYTLKPPLLGASAVDDFLFHSRRGFCEHYASAFVFLMRAAGVPARVVTGYQGGEFNPLGKDFIVRGRDAHAWAEVWLAGRGWVRVDPTAAVAPFRVERGIEAALPPGEHPLSYRPWLQPLRLGWDVINEQWNQWVLGYNQDRQHQFLSALTPLLLHWQGMVWALGLGAGTLILVITAFLWPRMHRLDPASREYQRYCRTLARLGLRRGAAESPEDFARRAILQYPNLDQEISRITRLYLACRYGLAEAGALAELHHAILVFRPGRSRPARPG